MTTTATSANARDMTQVTCTPQNPANSMLPGLLRRALDPRALRDRGAPET
jgi:hypothetical protein